MVDARTCGVRREKQDAEAAAAAQEEEEEERGGGCAHGAAAEPCAECSRASRAVLACGR